MHLFSFCGICMQIYIKYENSDLKNECKVIVKYKKCACKMNNVNTPH